MTLTATPDMKNHVLYAGARSRKKTVTTPPPQQQSGNEMTPNSYLYLVPLGNPITYDLLPKWTENEEVICHVRAQVKFPPSIKPKKPSPSDRPGFFL